MQIAIYTTASDPRQVTKNISLQKQLTIKGFEASGVVDPVILLAYDDVLFRCNYAFIPAFNRYYFIRNMEIIDGHRVRVTMHADVLMSYDGVIRGLTGIIGRNEKQYNLYLNDKMFQTYNYINTSTQVFPAGFTANQSFVLTVAGGGTAA